MTPNLRGSLYMTAAMAGFAAEDAFLKAASQSIPVGEAILIMGLIGIAVFSALAMRAGNPPIPRAMFTGTMALRSGFEITGRLFYALAIALTPISLASAILQATPLVVVLGAAVIFGETVGLKRWLLIVLGFIGVLIILRPGLDGFSALSLLALVAMLGFAGRDLATRAAPPALSNAQLGVTGFIMLTLSGVIITAVTGKAVLPNPPTLGLIAGAATFGIAAYAALTTAMRCGEIAVVTPFRYTRLLFAMILGITVFGERPDAATLTGAAIIVACGVIILGQTRRRA
ncbi:DMT family transporter [Cypionkella sp.]|uniref:DMT family transporter n=1 Tax=Cypionkella sp. TaxID=2811411 RepID=UPI00271B6E34|nr:DMT family transporter [Cypionkella sp.]MDO8985014.1 DMT family transporter [Cypionkella sp.]MDP2047429.1 DMT family transporter [Cypionkella sp.]